MNTAEILERTRRYGVTLTPHGDRLRMTAPVKPPDDLIAAIKAHKPELMALLTDRAERVLHAAVAGTGWTADDLRAALSEADRADLEAGHVTVANLRSFIALVHDRQTREAGQVPASYTERAYCHGCGPVWLWISATVHGCPWCANRRHGRPVPRP